MMHKIPKFQTPSMPLRPKTYLEENEPVWKTEFKQRQAQEEADYQKDMSQPYYQAHPKPTKEQWRRQRTKQQQNQGTVRQTDKVSAPVRAVNNYVGRAKYEATHGGVTSPQYIYPALALAGTGAYGLVTAPAAMTAGAIGGTVGSKAVDTGTKFATGKPWAQWLSSKTGMATEAAEMTNPGMWIGGGAGVKGLKLAKQRVLDAAYNNITPMGYTNTPSFPFFNHKQEIIDMTKEFFTPKRIDTSVNTYPKWYIRTMDYLEHNPQQRSFGLIAAVKFRDEAWRLATNQKPRIGLYTKNTDGTYSFNMDVVNQVRNNRPLVLAPIKTGENTGLALDNITTNGGFTGIKLNNMEFPSVTKQTYIGKPSLTMTDVWDLQPFKDTQRSAFPLLTKLGNKYPRIFGKIKNTEVLHTLGGNPFTLNHTFPEGQVHLYAKPSFKIPK